MSYERLTEATSIADYCSTAECYEKCDKCYVKKMFCRLCELEDKIENGTLVELPCGKPCEKGDKYYIIDVKRQKIFKGEITYINYDKTYGYICQFSWKDRDYMVPSNLELLGTFFNEQLNHFHMYKTQAEAEEKLRELRGEK